MAEAQTIHPTTSEAQLITYDGVDDYFDQSFDVHDEEHDFGRQTSSDSSSLHSADHLGDLPVSPEPGSEHKKKKHFKIMRPGKLLHIHHAHHHDRKVILQEAAELGKTGEPAHSGRHLTVLYNPISGAGVAKKLVEHMVEPVLRLAGASYDVVATEYRGFATEFMLKLDPSKTTGVLICGGDGLVHEVVTGFFRRPDHATINVTLGLVPSGTANAMAHELHAHPSKSHAALVGRAALAAARNHTRRVDVISAAINDKPEDNTYALSVFGWGLAGTVAKVADQLRWIPGQKRFRYDLAGFVSMMKDWPIKCKAAFSYPMGSGGEWVSEEIDCLNFTATNLPWLGVDHPMTSDVGPDDGYLVVSYAPSSLSKMQVVEMGMSMKNHHYLMEHKFAKTVKVPEFKLTGVEPGCKYDMNIDGDPMPASDVHIKVLHQALKVFAEPKAQAGPLMVKQITHHSKHYHALDGTAPPMPAPRETPPITRSGGFWSASV